MKYELYKWYDSSDYNLEYALIPLKNLDTNFSFKFKLYLTYPIASYYPIILGSFKNERESAYGDWINSLMNSILLDNSKKTDNFNLIFEGSIDALLLNGIAILDSFMTEDQISKITEKMFRTCSVS